MGRSKQHGRKAQASRASAGAAQGGGHSRVTAAHVQLNRKITAAAEGGQQKVLKLVQSCCQDMSLVNASTAWHCIARLEAEERQSPEAGPRLAALRERTKVLLSEFLAKKDEDPHHRCVATITWSCAKLKLHDAAMMSALGDLAVRWLWSFQPFELTNVLWGFAKLQAEHANFFQLTHNYIFCCPQLFSTRSLSMAAWAFATIRFDACNGLLCKMAGAFVAGLAAGDNANPVTIANMAWGLATARAQVPREALEAVGAAAAAELGRFKAHELSLTLWAFARLGACPGELFARAMDLLRGNQRLREEIHSQGIANLLWAFARYSEDVQDSDAHVFLDVLAALLPTLMRLLPKLNSVEMSSSVWAISKLVPRWGQHPAADSILVEAAKGMMTKPQLLAGMSYHGASGVLSAYSDFFQGSPRAPRPCRALVERLVGFCAGAAPEAREGREAADLPELGSCEAAACVPEAERKLAEGVAVAEPLHGVQGPAAPLPAPAGLRAAPGPGAAAGPGAARAGRPAPAPALPAAEVPASRLAARSMPPAPGVAVLEALAVREGAGCQGRAVDLAVEVVGGTGVAGAAGVVAEVFANFGRQESLLLRPGDADASGVYRLRLPEYEGRWRVCFTLTSHCGKAIGNPTSVSFFSKHTMPAKPTEPMVVRLKAQDYHSGSTYADSTCSFCSDTDNEVDYSVLHQRVI